MKNSTPSSSRWTNGVSALGSKLDSMIEEMRAGFAALNHKSKATPEDGASSENRESNSVSAGNKSTSPMPTFDGTDALAWLARAEQYFLISETAPENRVGVAMVALAGAALPWYQLLRKRVPDLSRARFARELMKRFGGNGALDEYEAFAAVRHTGSLPSHIRLPTPAMVTAPLLYSSPDILQFQPSFLPLLQHFDPAAAADHAKLMVSSGPPTTTMVSAPWLSSSPDIQIQPPFLPLRV